jgi:hypothetical protein
MELSLLIRSFFHLSLNGPSAQLLGYSALSVQRGDHEGARQSRSGDSIYLFPGGGTRTQVRRVGTDSLPQARCRSLFFTDLSARSRTCRLGRCLRKFVDGNDCGAVQSRKGDGRLGCSWQGSEYIAHQSTGGSYLEVPEDARMR